MHGGGNRTVRLTAANMRRLISEMLDIRMRRDYARFASYVDPRVVVYCNAWREGIVGPDVWSGAPALSQLFRRTDEDYFPLDHEVLDTIVDGDRAAVRWRGDWRRHATSKIYTIDAAHFLRWDENGLVVEMHEFFDSYSPALSTGAELSSLESLLTPLPAGLTRAEMEHRARRLACFDEGGPDADLLREWCSPDIVCEFLGDRARIPYAGRHTGLDRMIGIIQAIRVDCEQHPIGVPEMLVESGRVAGRRQVAWRHRGTGRVGCSELADFIRFEDGKVVEFIEFRDTGTLLRMQD